MITLTPRAPTAAVIARRCPRTRMVLILGMEYRGERQWVTDDTWVRAIPTYDFAPHMDRDDLAAMGPAL